MSKLRLTALRISRSFNGKLDANLTIEGQYGSTTLQLSDEMSARIVDLCADDLARNVQEMTATMAAEIRTLAPKPAAPAITDASDADVIAAE